MNFKRIISGVILIAILTVLLLSGSTFAINISTSTLAIMAINEYFNSFKEKRNLEKVIGTLFAIPIAFLNILPIEFFIVLLPVLIATLFLIVIVTEMKTDFKNIAFAGFGIIYIILFIIFIPLTYKLNNGKYLIWYLAIAAWGTDTFAYFAGITLGKHKFSKISPKKSVEGCIGGVIGALAITLIYTLYLNKMNILNVSYLTISGISIALSVLSEIGDLAASSIKRYNDVKDFSNLIPGHGGILDRIDSILFIAPFAYFLLILI